MRKRPTRCGAAHGAMCAQLGVILRARGPARAPMSPPGWSSIMHSPRNDNHARPTPPALMRAIEVARHLGVGIRTVWKLKATGKLPAVTVLGTTRFRTDDVAR